MSGPVALLRLLADGREHSVAALAAALDTAPEAVAAGLRALVDTGHVTRGGAPDRFRIDAIPPLLDADTIRDHLSSSTGPAIASVEVLDSVDSTNRYLFECPPDAPGRVAACLAEEQTAGRGRRGRAWYSPFGASLYLSMRYTFAAPPAAFGALALGSAVAVADALDVPALRIKWPNDLLVDGDKLGGILVEATWPGEGAVTAVIGIGINVALPPDSARRIDQPWTDLATVTGQRPDRNRLAARIIVSVAELLERFEAEGFEPYRPRYEALESLTGHPISVDVDGRRITGEALGIDALGALRVRTESGERSVNAGDASRLRASA